MGDELTGRALDAAVAERVRGWDYRFSVVNNGISSSGGLWCKNGAGVRFCQNWAPSTSMGDAWQVAEAMRAKGWRFSTTEGWGSGFITGFRSAKRAFTADETTLPLAICRAALAAVGEG